MMDLEKFKLKSPRIRVRLNDVELGFGDTEPLEGRRYVLAGNTVHLITDSYYPRLIAPHTSFISLALLPEPTRLEAIELPQLTLTHDAQGWKAAPSASPDAVNTLVQEWMAAQALQVRPYVAPATQDKPETVTLRVAPGVLDRRSQRDSPSSIPGVVPAATPASQEGVQTSLRFIIISRAPELILARPELGVQYHLPQDAAQRLLTLSADTSSP